MKEIRLPSHIFLHSQTGASMDVNAAIAHTTEARRNANKVVSAALFVEREVEAFLNNYLYPVDCEQKTFLARHLLGSDSLTFASKRRLLLELVREKKWLEGPGLDEFEKGLRGVMSYRNALTHGNVIEKDEGTVLEFFENGPRSQVLNDAYWDKLVATFDLVVQHIVNMKMRASEVGAALYLAPR